MKNVKKIWLGILGVLVLGLSACVTKTIIFKTYQGPIFALTSGSDIKGIAMERNMELDFSSYENTTPGEASYPFNESRKVYVNDEYVLTNVSAEAITFEAVYPFAGTLSDKKEWIPEICVNGKVVDSQIVLGSLVEEWSTFEESHMQEAFADVADAEDRVIVYKFKNLGYDGANEDATTPQLRVSYVENENADVLPANWDSWSSDDREGTIVQTIGFDLSSPEKEGYGKDGYLVVLGEDISDVVAECYATSTGAYVLDVEIEMERYESTLREVAWEIFAGGYGTESAGEQMADEIPEEELFGAFLKGVCASRDRVLNRVVNYDSLDNAWYDLYDGQRVMYAVFAVTVPVGGNVVVQAGYEKQAGHGVYEEDGDLDRYDIWGNGYSVFEFASEKITAVGSDDWQSVETENGVKTYLHP